MSNLHSPSIAPDPPEIPLAQRVATEIAKDCIESAWNTYWAFSIHEQALKRALIRVLSVHLSHGKPLAEPLTPVEVRLIDEIEGNTDWREETVYADI